ncbi:MAG: amidohydrolase [Proteobacteria bacterium]|nr:amidohydrolase [Pseudomonadota bacterium]
MPDAGPIDCDVHPFVPSLKALHPYLDRFWRDTFIRRGLEELNSTSYPTVNPLTARADWREAGGKPPSTPARLAANVLDPMGTRLAICNCLYGVQLLYNEDMAIALTRALNDWIAREWLDADPRLRASIVVAPQNPHAAAEEIDRCAADPRFVQVLMLVSGEAPLGKRQHWPIFEAAQRNNLALGIHAGSAYRHPVTAVGWPTTFTEDYVNQAQAFQSGLTSLLAEGVFTKFPDLTVVLIESGVTWLPAHAQRLTKTWKGVRPDIPWVVQAPDEIMRARVRLTVQPFDGPPDARGLERILDHLGSDEILLFATDYPHWQFDGLEALPPGIPDGLRRKMMVDNPLRTYVRLKQTLGETVA